VAEKVRAHCELTLGVPEEETLIPSQINFEPTYILTEDTPTTGGLQ